MGFLIENKFVKSKSKSNSSAVTGLVYFKSLRVILGFVLSTFSPIVCCEFRPANYTTTGVTWGQFINDLTQN